MAITPTRVALLVALALLVGVVWYVDGRGRWREIVSRRLLYGVPWGTAVTVAVVVTFYLLVQDGFRHWNDPVIFAFITWSYFYPEGILTAGLAHANPGHLLSNMTATIVFGVIAEYAWGHYPRSSYSGPNERPEQPIRPDGGRSDDSRQDVSGLSNPWIRAFVVFPAALLAVAVFTATFSLGPGLGFSGAVFAIIGFAVVVRPLTSVIGLTVTSSLSLVVDAFATPIVRETVEIGAPMPPAWAGIGFQAHLLGFVVGAVAAVALLTRRRYRPSFARISFGVFVVGTVQSLWLLVWGSGDEYVLYRGLGVVMVVGLVLVVAGAVAGSDRRVPRPLERYDRVPSRRTLAIAWLGAVILGFVLGVAITLAIGESILLSIGTLVVVTAILAIPGLPPVVPDRIFPTPVSIRHVAITALVIVTALVAIVSVPFGLVVVGEDTEPETEVMVVEDYAVTYAENATSGQSWVVGIDEGEDFDETTVSGVIVVNDQREMWTVAVTDDLLAFEGEDEVTIGGVSWRETIHVDRIGWEVPGNETVYAVDLERGSDGETVRAFTTEPSQPEVELEGHTVEVIPTDDGFDLAVSDDGELVGSEPIPDPGESTIVGDLSVSTIEGDDDVRVVAEIGETRVQVAERERYP